MHVSAVHLSPTHQFSKCAVPQIVLQQGRGVVGDAHCGETVRHRSRVAKDPTQPNLRQVHLIPGELLEGLLDELRGGGFAGGFAVNPGQLGENITIGASAKE